MGRWRGLTAGLLVAVVFGGLAQPVSAAPVDDPGAHFMGSTLAAHEPGAARQRLAAVAPAGTPGIDVSHWQGNVDWASVAAGGTRWAYMKATESNWYRDPEWDNNFRHSYEAGLIRGSYHFARPDQSSAAEQANFFADNGGIWTPDGLTLPPVLDIEYNPNGPTCYGFTADQLVAWVRDFLSTMHARTGRWPVVYTTRGWWRSCTGNNPGLGLISPLWIAGYNGDPINLPSGWPSHAMWQYASDPVDQDVYNGGLDELRAVAVGDEGGIINAHYNALGGAGYLGNPTGGRYPVGGGTAQDYANGTIYYSSGSGAWSVRGPIATYHRQAGGVTGFLGFPGYDETVTPDGRFVHFQYGSVYWTSGAGAHEVHGGIRAKYAALGWEGSYLRFPVTDERDTANKLARYNNFQNGAIYYVHATATSSAITGGILGKWQALGGEASPLGFPVTDELDTSNHLGRYNDFQAGSIYYVHATGTSSAIMGGIRGKWIGLGAENSFLGLPISDELETANHAARYNNFQSGSIYYNKASGLSFAISGGIRGTWTGLGAEGSFLGLPTSDEFAIGGGRAQNFEHGYITYNAATFQSVAHHAAWQVPPGSVRSRVIR